MYEIGQTLTLTLSLGIKEEGVHSYLGIKFICSINLEDPLIPSAFRCKGEGRVRVSGIKTIFSL
jgi:hypothetical protein